MDEMSKKKILVVDDEKNIQSALRRLMRQDYEVATAGSGPEALALIANGQKFDLIITDFRMPVMRGDEFAKALRQANYGGPIIVYTGNLEVNVPEAKKILLKPTDNDVMLQAVQDALASAA